MSKVHFPPIEVTADPASEEDQELRKAPIVHVTLRPSEFVWQPNYAILLDAEPERTRQFADEHEGCYVFVFMTAKPEWFGGHALPDYSEFWLEDDDAEIRRVLAPLAVANLADPMEAIDQYVAMVFGHPAIGPCDPVCIYDERAGMVQ